MSSESTREPAFDSTVAGGVLGTGWGAGTGAIVGHRLSYAGEGLAVGAALGLVAGVAAGYGYDNLEQRIALQEDDIELLRARNGAIFEELQILQERLDVTPPYLRGPLVTTVYFDVESTSLRSGAIAELEILAEYVKSSPFSRRLVISGHSDDSGGPEHAKRTAEARARNVAAVVSSYGVASDIISVEAHGSERPLASNTTEAGRQLNRRVDILIKH